MIRAVILAVVINMAACATATPRLSVRSAPEAFPAFISQPWAGIAEVIVVDDASGQYVSGATITATTKAGQKFSGEGAVAMFRGLEFGESIVVNVEARHYGGQQALVSAGVIVFRLRQYRAAD
jgi:hypothetical protein